MNERIQELKKQARKYAWENETHWSANAEREALFEEKFAELIVRECIRVPYNMWDKAELNADVAVKIEHRIKEHFGVEE